MCKKMTETSASEGDKTINNDRLDAERTTRTPSSSDTINPPSIIITKVDSSDLIHSTYEKRYKEEFTMEHKKSSNTLEIPWCDKRFIP